MLPLYDCFRRWSAKGTVWLYSDPHFSDIDQLLMDKRWPSDEEQLKRINSKVGKNDTVVILGDVGNLDWAKQIKGYKVLIMGNHDSGRTNYEYKEKVIYYTIIECPTKSDVITTVREEYPEWDIDRISSTNDHNAWFVTLTNHLFDEVYEGPLMIAEKILLSHEPVNIPWAFNIHGHDHAGWRQQSGSLNVCSNVIDWEPISLNKLFKDGFTSKVPSIHRITINEATKKSLKR